ncbi:MAG: hypothetical protein JSV86_16225 [Gemmatimonadota bacterium]|nr:MAG: hypothetical protein JSV86_16225 [Gemmatimonadota bacterium]
MKSYWLTPIVLLAAAVACGPPVLYDTAGRPVKDPMLMAQVDGLWLAVDSSAAGVRAVLEVQVVAPGGQLKSWDRTDLELWTGAAVPLSPARLREGNVRCWPTSPWGARCRTNTVDESACAPQMQPREAECYYILCAEFALERVPSPGESIVVNLGGVQRVLQLAVVK